MIQSLFQGLKDRLTGIEVLLGPEATTEHGQPPRIVITPVAGSDTFTGPIQKEKASKSLRTRNAVIEAHLWGADYDAIELPPTGLLHRFISALHTEAHGCYTIMPGSGYQDAREAGSKMNQGRLYILVLSIETPVVKPPMETATITTTTNTSDLA
jgi:hypothetical protein